MDPEVDPDDAPAPELRDAEMWPPPLDADPDVDPVSGPDDPELAPPPEPESKSAPGPPELIEAVTAPGI